MPIDGPKQAVEEDRYREVTDARGQEHHGTQRPMAQEREVHAALTADLEAAARILGVQLIVANGRSDLETIKEGRIAHEQYELGNTEKTRWMSMSIIKSFTASLVGAAIKVYCPQYMPEEKPPAA